jgi:hypothetical protein
VEDKSAEVIACGELEGVDLAVLKVQGLEISHLPLGGDGHKEMQCCIPGFTELSGKQKKAEPLEGSLGSEVVLKAPDSPRVKAWKLWIEGKTLLESGYSGSPVICTTTNTVFAVASHQEYQGERGYAVSLDHLKDVWSDIPEGLFSVQHQARRFITGGSRETLESLFQNLPISDEQLRIWCRQIMPPSDPHQIPANSNSLDLLTWLIERGRLARGQVPLLSLLSKLASPEGKYPC